MKKYPKYKDSGIPWIGEIPAHWEVKRLGLLGSFTSSGIDKKIKENEELVNMINYTDIYGNYSYMLTKDRNYMVVSCPKEKKGKHQVHIGDLIFTPSSETADEIGLSAVVYEELPNTVFSYHVLRLRFFEYIDLRYKKYLCNNYFVLNQFSKEAKGTTRQILDRNSFKNVLVIIPPLSEQIIIANYLDRKTAEIDEIIAKKEKLLELYEEEKKAIINRAVTRGLNPNVKMKDSGVPYLEEIPQHWDVKKLKYVARVNPSNIDKKSKEGEKEVFLCNYIDVYNSDYISDNIGFMKATANEKQIEKFKLRRGDVIITKDSETPDDIGVPAYVTKDFYNVVCGYHLAHIRPIAILGEYLFRLFQCKFIQSYFEISANGITRYGLGIDKINGVLVLIPPLDEQQQIVNYIENQLSIIDQKIEKTKKSIELLKEYKTALISEVVTGKRKVVKNY